MKRARNSLEDTRDALNNNATMKNKWRISETDDPEWWEACCAEAAVGGEHVKECWAVPRGREDRAPLRCLFGNLTQLATFLSVCETGHLSLFALWRFFFRTVFWGTPAVLVIYAAGLEWEAVGSVKLILTPPLSHTHPQRERNKDLSVAIAPGQARPPPLSCVTHCCSLT